MKQFIAIALVLASIAFHLSQPVQSLGAEMGMKESAEYQCQMLMAETTDWEPSEIVEACQQ